MMLILHLLYFFLVIPAIRKGSGNNNRNMVDVGGDACLNSETLMIMCELLAGSGITRQWYRDGVLQSETGHKLTISANNKGTNYTCVVSNQCGEDRATTIMRSK